MTARDEEANRSARSELLKAERAIILEGSERKEEGREEGEEEEVSSPSYIKITSIVPHWR